MTYSASGELAQDQAFQARERASLMNYASVNVNDKLAQAVIRSDPIALVALLNVIPIAPGVADAATNTDGTIDQTKVTDAQIDGAISYYWANVTNMIYPAPAA